MQVNYGILYVNCNLHMAESKKTKKQNKNKKIYSPIFQH